MKTKLALPKGRLQASTARFLERAGLQIEHYSEGSRSYRPLCKGRSDLFLKVFHEKDIAIQVAIGNYDLGICRLDWVEELLSKYHGDALVKVRELGSGRRTVYAAISADSGKPSWKAMRESRESIRIVSEYPNLAESFALKQRLKKFQILPVWGAAGVYLPENAEVAILAETSAGKLGGQGLFPVTTILESTACLVANKRSLEKRNLDGILAALCRADVSGIEQGEPSQNTTRFQRGAVNGSHAFLALPDGHQQRPAVEFLKRAGIKVAGYGASLANPRPRMELDGVAVKVIRPQDMPLQVANGNFDMAITGSDWVRDHLLRFPSSPLKQLLDLGFGKVQIVAVVGGDVPVSRTEELRKLERKSAVRIASEYVNIADRFALENRLAPYKIIPTWGASEAFLPEDADVLIENTETGSTIAMHNLKIIDTLFESSACLIANSEALDGPKKERILRMADMLDSGRAD